ncbi:MAG: GGDEF domain-containing protein [Lachnospiraceae bacterium]|nr:GGDEF domain-containing protein [Lachnospiraceae bacterium]
MKKMNDIKQMLSQQISTERFKYKLIIYSITMVHIILFVLFNFLHIWPMVVFNVGSVAVYIKCIDIIKRGYEHEIIKVFYMTYGEIIIHSFVATICIGWRFGFPQYIIGLIPFGYYMCATLLEEKRRYMIATALGMIAVLSFIACRSLSLFVGSIFLLELPAFAELLIYIFNSICNFVFLFMVTVIFVWDMQRITLQLRSQNVALDNMASIDPLTGLYNRRSMQDFFAQALKAENDFSLIMCDIDNFKRVNDTYGHDFGDVVLKEVSHIVQQQVRDNGYVCRWGGEEILILSNDRLDHTCKIAENIRHDVEQHVFCCCGKELHCTLTLGVAGHRAGNTVEDTIKHADSRLYYGKQNGKNRVVTPYNSQ